MTDTLPAPAADDELAPGRGPARVVAGLALSFTAGIGGSWTEGKLGRDYPAGPFTLVNGHGSLAQLL